MKLSVVITTRNESANIANCIRSFDAYRDDVEIVVVDNSSTDDTKRIAAELGAVVLDRGPERCAQRNLGWRTASADWVVVLDADMMLPPETIDEILSKTRQPTTNLQPPTINLQPPTFNLQLVPLAYWIPEIRTGTGIRVKARNFERSFYDGTAIDALRLFHKSVLEATGGYDESIIAGGEDWELDIRILALGTPCAILKNHLVHNEKQLTLRRVLEKKAYYSKSIADYKAKWPNHPALKKQFGFYYRFFVVFVEKGKWRKLLRHPILALVMYFERFAIGLTYLLNR